MKIRYPDIDKMAYIGIGMLVSIIVLAVFSSLEVSRYSLILLGLTIPTAVGVLKEYIDSREDSNKFFYT